MRLQALIIALFLWIAIGCENGTNNENAPFQPYFNFSEETERLQSENPQVEKTLTAEGFVETKLDTINWAKEFKPFLEANINKPNFRELYDQRITELESGERHVVYLANKAELEVRKVAFTYLQDQCKEVRIEKTVNVPVYESSMELVYRPGKDYSIQTMQKAAVGYETNMKIEGRFQNPSEAWLVKMDLGGDILPFNCSYAVTNGEHHLEITNDEERINVSDIKVKGDSIFAMMPVFDSEIRGKLTKTGMTGYWHNYAKGKDYKIPVEAESGVTHRFDPIQENKPQDFSGKWEVYFSYDQDSPSAALGSFTQEGEKLTGTFLTETGDYRYLEGSVHNDTMCLSTFDGSHAFFFKAGLMGEDQLMGYFRSGTHWKESFTGKRNESFELRDPESLTFLKEKNQKIEFSFPNMDSNMVSLSDPKFKDKVVIIEVMGSWCPNCMDGTSYLKEIYDRYNEDGLEVVALAYERSTVFSEARKTVLRHKNDLGAKFEFLIAGRADKKEAAESLPMLNHILSFPTTIFIDRDGMVRKIYTGFNGPGTGHYYEQFHRQNTAFVESLLREKPSVKVIAKN